MKNEDSQARRLRHVFWAYNRIWAESRLLLAFLLGGTLVCCALRDTGNGHFRLDVFIPAALFFLLFLLFPLSYWRFTLQGLRDVQKRRIAVKDITVFSCGDDEKHIMQSRGVDVEKYRKLCIVDQDLKKLLLLHCQECACERKRSQRLPPPNRISVPQRLDSQHHAASSAP